MGSRRHLRPTSSWRHGLALALAVACAITLAFESRAFVSATTNKGRINNLAVGASPRGGIQMHGSARPTVSSTSWHVAGCAAFVFVSGVQALWAARTQTLQATSRKVVRVVSACRSAAPRTTVLPGIPNIVHTAASELPSNASASLSTAMGADVIPRLPCDGCQGLSLPSTTAPAGFIAGVAAEFIAAANPRSARRGGAARRVGTSRCKSARRAAAGASQAPEATNRRQVGAKLIPVVAPGVVAPSFDASKLRTKIQVGLRIQSITRSASAREGKTAASSVAASTASGVYLDVSGNGFATIKADGNKTFTIIPVFHTWPSVAAKTLAVAAMSTWEEEGGYE